VSRGDLPVALPAGWRSIPLRAVARRREESGRADLPLLSVYRDLGIVPREGREDNYNKPGTDLSTYKVVYAGDLVLNKMKTWQGSLAVSMHQGIVSPAYFVCELNDRVSRRFLHHQLRSRPYIAAFAARSKGIRPQQWDLPWEAFKSIHLAVPPRKEQKAIANFLDRETARIDRLIEAKRQLRQRLRQRRVEMARVLTTRGLRPGRLRETGVDWLGSIPREWTLWRLGHAFKSGSGTTPDSQSLDYYGGEIPWLTTSELRDLPIARTHQSVTDAALRDYPALKTFPRGALVIAMYGATIGRLGLLEIETTTNQACCVLYESDVLLTKFVFYWLWAHRHHIVALGSGGGQGNISQEIIRNLRVPTPPRQEQEEIVVFLDAEGSRWLELEARLIRQIELLTEHRQALITAAVTGQINVAGEAA
jgi:type I restriction enzyme S subunit